MKTLKCLCIVALLVVGIVLIASPLRATRLSDANQEDLLKDTPAISEQGQEKNRLIIAFDPDASDITMPEDGDEVAPIPGCTAEVKAFNKCMKRCLDFGRPRSYCKSRFCYNQHKALMECSFPG